MSTRIPALVKPELLVWARESAGLTKEQVANKLRVKPEKVKGWEGGEIQPTVKQLRRLSRIYKRPLAVFYLPEKPLDFQPLRDFRRISAIHYSEPIAQLNLEIRQAYYRREVALDLMEELKERRTRFSHRITAQEDPEDVGSKIRQLLKIAIVEQKGWSNIYEALNKWRFALEKAGVLVFQSSALDAVETQGFSISEFPLPVIVVNNRDAPARRIFTLLHELVHVMSRQSGICDINEDYQRPQSEQRFEVFCNRAAGASLLPKRALLEDQTVVDHGRRPEWSDDELLCLASQYKVSREVVLRRLLICERTTDSFYERKRDQFLEEYEEMKKKRTAGFAPPHSRVLSLAGVTYVRLVLDGYHQEKITSSDVSDFLDVKVKHLSKIENEVITKLFALGAAF